MIEHRQSRRHSALVVAVVTALLVSGVAVGVGVIDATAQPSLDCVGTGGGATYVTDSGLTVYENDTAGAVDRFYFPRSDTVRFEYVTDEINLSADGTAEARLEDGTGATTCLGDVSGGPNPITITPNGTSAVVLASNASGFAYHSPVYDPGDGAVDLTFSASEDLELTVQSTGLAEGTTVVADDVDSGDQLAQGTVQADGSLPITIPSGTRSVDLHTPATTPTETPTSTPTETPTDGGDQVGSGPVGSGPSDGDDGGPAGGDDGDEQQSDGDGASNVEVTSSQEGDQTQTIATVQNAQAGQAVPMDVPATGDAGPVDTSSVSVTPSVDTDFSIEITESPEPLVTSPTFELGDGTTPLSYISVEHTIPNADIQSATFTHRVDESAIDSMQSSAEDLSLYRYDGQSWSEQPTQVVGREGGEIILQTTTDALSEWTMAAKRPLLNVTDTQVSLQAATTEEEVTIQVFVQNTGGTDGVYEAELLLNDETVDRTERTVPDGGTVAVNFERTFDQPGRYEVQVNDVLIGQVNISAADETVDVDTEQAGEIQAQQAGTESDPEDGGGSGIPVLPVGIALVVVAGLGVWYYLTRIGE